MALRLSDLVVCGEIFNTSWYSVHGWLALRGREQVVHLQLTGNCAPDLAGWHFRFENPAVEGEHEAAPDQAALLQGFAWQQVGPTGVMTTQPDAADKASLNPGAALASPQRAPKLYLEWFGQNGRVVVEVDDPQIELLEYNDLEANPAGPPLRRADTEDELFDEDPSHPDLLDDPWEDDYEIQLDDRPWEDVEEEDDDSDSLPWLDTSADEDDPYELFPDFLKQQFDEEASQMDRALDLDSGSYDAPWLGQDDQDSSDVLRELELMDDCLERGEGELLADLFDGPVRLPRPDQLQDDNEAEQALKKLLAHLARCGVSLAVCHHFTPRDAYRLLIEEICVEERAYRELQGTQWVQTFMTSEYCLKCEEEFEREYQDYERRRKERGDGSDDDIPF